MVRRAGLNLLWRTGHEITLVINSWLIRARVQIRNRDTVSVASITVQLCRCVINVVAWTITC